MKRVIFLFILCSNLCVSAQEELSFDLIFKGKSIGVLDAEMKEIDGVKQYNSHTKIDYHFLISIDLEYKYDVFFSERGLKEADVDIFVHGKEKTKTRTIKNTSNYKFYLDEKKPTTISDSIAYSTILLLFKEPKGISKVYAEEHGEFHDLKYLGDGKYEKTNPKGRVSTYFYKKGRLVRAKVDAGIISFSLKATN